MTCNKVPFPTEAAARAQVQRMARLRSQKGKRLRPYWCDRCGQWHLTSWSKADERAARRDLRRQREIQEEQAS